MALLDSKLHNQQFDTRFPGYEFRINFPTDAGVPGEELVAAEVDSMQLNSHAVTFSEKIKQKHSWMTKQEVEDYRKELISDSKDIADATRRFESVQVGEDNKPIDSSQKKSSEQTSQKA